MNPFVLLLVLVPILIVLLALVSATTVQTGMVGTVFVFGRFWRILRPGLNFVIPFIERVEYYSTQIHQDELPDEPEGIDRTDPPAAGKKPPFRVLQKGKEEALFWVKNPDASAANKSDEYKQIAFTELKEKHPEKHSAIGEDSLNAPLTSEVAVVVEWQLKAEKEEIQNFLENVQPAAGRTRRQEVRKRMEDMTSRVLQELLGPTTLGHSQEMIRHFSSIIQMRLEHLVGEGVSTERSWGIHIVDAYIKSINPGIRVNEARADAAAAMSRKHAALRTAEGVAEATKLQAAADKIKEIEKGEGEAGRIAAMARVMADENARFIAELDVQETIHEGWSTAIKENKTPGALVVGGNGQMIPTLPLGGSK